jgi:metal-dependent amidase/aminoacylase/carboxypeptidase family protein
MIYTVTFNPAIDYVVHLHAPLQTGCINRTAAEDFQFGGKGINVSGVLKTLGLESVALGFVAGFTGQALEQGLQRQGIRTDLICVEEGMTRINVGKIISGTSSNVISDEAYMEIEMRGENTELIEYMDHYFRRILESAAQMHGCTVSFKLMAFSPSLTCDQPLAEKIDRICKQYLNLNTTESPVVKVNGSDDVSHMLDRVRSHGGLATYLRIHNKQTTGNHNRKYTLDEEYMSRCVKIFSITAYELMK